MSVELADIVERQALEGADAGLSSARLERVRLDDGRWLVLKHLPPEGDWLTRATGSRRSLRLLWDGGVLDRVAHTIDHTILEVVDAGGADVVVMRDASDDLLPQGVQVDGGQLRRLVAGLAQLHRDFEGSHVDGLCTLAERFTMFAPDRHRADSGTGSHPLRDSILRGWEAFADIAPDDVVDVVFRLHADARPLGAALSAAAPATLLHGDPKLDNLGLGDDRVVAIDWGDLTGMGPAVVDVAWLAAQDPWRYDELPDALFSAYNELGGHVDERAVDLACMGALAQFGFKLAVRHRSDDEAVRRRAGDVLAWWVRRVGVALERTWAPAQT